MKFFYLQYLKVRVWMLRRRLRMLGFRDMAQNTHLLTLLRLKIERVQRPSHLMRWLELGLLIAGIAIWFKYYVRFEERFQTTLPQLKQNSQPVPSSGESPSSFHGDLSARRAA